MYISCRDEEKTVEIADVGIYYIYCISLAHTLKKKGQSNKIDLQLTWCKMKKMIPCMWGEDSLKSAMIK